MKVAKLRCKFLRILSLSFLVLLLGMMSWDSEASLSSISVTPANSTINLGQIQTFTATGTFSDGSVHALPKMPIAAGAEHTCAILSDGSVECWGQNGSGALGNGTNTDSNTPVSVNGIGTVVAIAAADNYSCALLENGNVECWGSNGSGQLGNGSTIESLTPVLVVGINNALGITAGEAHACALLGDGTVKCWGDNSHGSLGNGSGTQSPSPVSVTGINNAVGIAAGRYHTCAVLLDGSVKCWGYNSSGELGNGTTTNSSIPVSVIGINTATAVTAPGNGIHTCALLSDGSLKCWGENSSGQLGNGTTVNSSIPVTVTGVNDAVAIAAGSSYTCAQITDGSLRCWGDNTYGQLGNGSTTINTTPVTVSGISNATAIAAGYDHACTVLTDGSMECWGMNLGMLGNGSSGGTSATPVVVAGITSATAIASGESYTCALLASGAINCWGTNVSGNFGNGSTTNSFIPVPVDGINNATAIAVGGTLNQFHTCAVLSDESVRCWGYNFDGELGNGATTDSASPVAVSGISNATSVSTGNYHTCALLADQSVACWGKNGNGQLGDGTTTNSSSPVTVSGINTATAIVAAGEHTCALLADGSVWCWGSNFSGELGDGSAPNAFAAHPTPVQVVGINSATAIGASEEHTCAVLVDGSARCWGYNGDGVLGDGTTTNSLTPVVVSGIGNAKAITAASSGPTTCALLADGSVRCWGASGAGQLGNGVAISNSYSLTPVAVSGLVTATAISSGGDHSCALRNDGLVKCWGGNSHGDLGNGVQFSGPGSPTPAQVFSLEQSTISAMTWSSGDTVVAPISGNGAAFGVSSGNSTITAAVGSISGSATLFVGSSSLPTYTIGGTISGLIGTLVMKDNGGDNLSISENGGFTFPTALPSAATYTVSVATQPTGQSCTISNASGTVVSSNVTNVFITCTTATVTYTVGGTISGLSGSIVLKNSGTDTLTESANGNFTFSTALASGSTYGVSIVTQPVGQSCSVTNGSGTISNANVSDVAVSCTASVESGGSSSPVGGNGGGGGEIGPFMLGLLGLVFAMRMKA